MAAKPNPFAKKAGKPSDSKKTPAAKAASGKPNPFATKKAPPFGKK